MIIDTIINIPPIINRGVNISSKKKKPINETYTGSYDETRVADDGPISFKPE
jgi:hypothetical protein